MAGNDETQGGRAKQNVQQQGLPVVHEDSWSGR
jgi:hypothetical protein